MADPKAGWAYANNARIAVVFLSLAIVLLVLGILAVLAFGADAAFASSALLTLAIFLLVFSLLVFLPRVATRGAVSFSLYSRRSMDEAEQAVRTALEALGRTARVERVRTRSRTPPRIVTADGLAARIRIEPSRRPVPANPASWTEIIEVFPMRDEPEGRALRGKIAESLGIEGTGGP
jgi:hypothetical protein